MYNWFFTSSGKLVIGGKNAKQNEEIMKKISSEDFILHTAAPGSPFCIIKNPNKQDLKEAAIFCACFSKEWKRGKKKAEVHIFRGYQVFKTKEMREGTFGVLGDVKRIKVSLKLALCFQKNKLRGVPLETFKKYKENFPKIILAPGKIEKEEAARIIKSKLEESNIKINLEEILQAIPSGGFSIK